MHTTEDVQSPVAWSNGTITNTGLEKQQSEGKLFGSKLLLATCRILATVHTAAQALHRLPLH